MAQSSASVTGRARRRLSALLLFLWFAGCSTDGHAPALSDEDVTFDDATNSDTANSDVNSTELSGAEPSSAEPVASAEPSSSAEPITSAEPGDASVALPETSDDTTTTLDDSDSFSTPTDVDTAPTSDEDNSTGDSTATENSTGDSSTDSESSSTDESSTDGEPAAQGLLWPIDCIVGESCGPIGYADIDNDGVAFDCSVPGYAGHEGADIPISQEQMDSGVAVYAAAAGEVLWAFDGKYDRCPDANQPDCQPPPGVEPGNMDGQQVCTELGPYCGTGEGQCFWCFFGGNVIVLRHEGTPGVFATRYDHLRNGSVLVSPGMLVEAGQKIAEVGSAGNSTGPHLHFEVWGTGFYELTEPWSGVCGPNTTEDLWEFSPPWAPLLDL